jgi:hypothetical protein
MAPCRGEAATIAGWCCITSVTASYHGQNSGSTEIYRRFAMPVRMLMTLRSRYRFNPGHTAVPPCPLPPIPLPLPPSPLPPPPSPLRPQRAPRNGVCVSGAELTLGACCDTQYTPGVAQFDYPDWMLEMEPEERAVLQQPAARRRSDIMTSAQMRGAAKL